MTAAQENIVKTYGLTVERVGHTHYRATNATGGSVEFGPHEGMLTPVEMLLAGLAGCASVDVDVVTSRRAEPEEFTVRVEADRVDEDGAARLSEVRAEFTVRFDESDAGRQAQSLVERLVAISHDTDCTVSRTVENPTRVRFTTA